MIALSRRPNQNEMMLGLGHSSPLTIYRSMDELFEQADFSNAVVVVDSEDAEEFPFVITLLPGKENNTELRILTIARKLSVVMGCRTVYSGDPDEGKGLYSSILFDEGVAYEVDDYSTKLFDGEGGHLKIVRRRPELDAQ